MPSGLNLSPQGFVPWASSFSHHRLLRGRHPGPTHGRGRRRPWASSVVGLWALAEDAGTPDRGGGRGDGHL